MDINRDSNIEIYVDSNPGMSKFLLLIWFNEIMPMLTNFEISKKPAANLLRGLDLHLSAD